MSLRTRLALNFALLGFVIVGLLLLISFFNLRQQLRNDLRQRLLDIVSLAALQQDGDSFIKIQSPLDPAFERIRLQNLQIRGSDPDLRFVYTMRYDENGIYFVVDAVTPDDPLGSPYGTRYFEPGPVLEANYKTISRPIIEDGFYTDEYGTFLSAYAPFYTSDGKPAGIIGVDITASKILSAERQALIRLAGLFLFSIPLVALSGWLLGNTLASPIMQLTGATIKVASGDMTASAKIESQDEIGTLAQNFNRMIAQMQELQSGLEKQVEERTAQLKAVNEVGRVATAILDPQELVSRVVHLISDQFGYYYAAIFLVDEKGEWATLQDATGEAGRVLKENKHRLRVGGNSMVGAAVSTSQPRIAQDVGAEPIRFENPLLPYTRSEIALPLAVGDRVLGALDVQSTKQAAFGPQEIETLQSMAHQVAIAFENARLFQEAQKRLEEMQMIQRQYVLESWKPLAGSESLEYKIGDEEARAGAAELEIPLALRDEIIGQLSLTTEVDWTPEQRNLIEAVATQAALALENARLVEESQSSAARERLLAEITGKVWASTTLDGILQTAVRELGRALDASEASIELKMDERHG